MERSERQLVIQFSKVLVRELEGTSLREVARQTGVPVSSLHGYCNGTIPRKLEHLLTLSKYLGLSIEQLLFDLDGKGVRSAEQLGHLDIDLNERVQSLRIRIEKI